MYEEFLGKGYHEKIRHMLSANEELLPNRIIDADLNISSMKMMIKNGLEGLGKSLNWVKDNTPEFKQLQSIGIYYLAAVLCVAMKSRTSSPPFDVIKYKRDWEKKRETNVQKGNSLLIGLCERK